MAKELVWEKVLEVLCENEELKKRLRRAEQIGEDFTSSMRIW